MIKQKRIIQGLLLFVLIGMITFLSVHTADAANKNSNNITVSFNLLKDGDGHQFAKIYGFKEGVQAAIWTYFSDYYDISAGNTVLYEIGKTKDTYQFVENGKVITLDINTGDIVNTENLKKEKVVDVVDTEYSLSSGKAYTVLVGKEKSGNYVWQYQTEEYDSLQNGNVSYKSNKNTVYLFVAGKLYLLNKQTGKIRSKTKKYSNLVGVPSMTFDKKGNVYAIEMFGQYLYKFSSKGKEIWHSRNIEKAVGAGILASGPEIKTGPDAKRDVYCAFVDWTGADDKDARNVFFNRNTGKIVYHD